MIFGKVHLSITPYKVELSSLSFYNGGNEKKMKQLKHYLIFFVTLSWISIFGQNIEIPDFYLDNAIRTYLDKPTGAITESDLSSLTRFVAVGRNITSIEGLEYAKNLTYLRLDNNNIQNSEDT